MCARPRVSYANADPLPAEPGVYAWFRDGQPVYAGVETGRQGLRGRLRKYRSQGNDLSRSSLRRNMAEHLLGLPITVSHRRPSQVLTDQVNVVNDWLATCQVAQKPPHNSTSHNLPRSERRTPRQLHET